MNSPVIINTTPKRDLKALSRATGEEQAAAFQEDLTAIIQPYYNNIITQVLLSNVEAEVNDLAQSYIGANIVIANEDGHPLRSIAIKAVQSKVVIVPVYNKERTLASAGNFDKVVLANDGEIKGNNRGCSKCGCVGVHACLGAVPNSTHKLDDEALKALGAKLIDKLGYPS